MERRFSSAERHIWAIEQDMKRQYDEEEVGPALKFKVLRQEENLQAVKKEMDELRSNYVKIKMELIEIRQLVTRITNLL